MKIAVSAESTNDLPPELLAEYNIKVIPFTIVLGDDTVKDGEITVPELLDFVNKSGILPKTTAINEFEYAEYFENIKKDYDAIVHIALSSEISSTYRNACRAAENIGNVFVVDSQSLTSGIGLLAVYASELEREGLSAQEIFEKVTARTKKLQVSFVVDRLDYLYKGGRCNSVQLLGANILKIHPRISLKDGAMGMDKKYRGAMNLVVNKFCNELLSEGAKPDFDKVMIPYTTATPEMLSEARQALKNAGFKNIYETKAGCTVASHCGENTLGLAFFYE